jgi:5'-AMP-activated protein kinase catalytic alpha subunit
MNSTSFLFEAGIYNTPDYLSKSVAQLIEKMLSVDPLKRATIKEIRESDWFKIDLPDYLFPKPTQENINMIDIDAVYEICEV